MALKAIKEDIQFAAHLSKESAHEEFNKICTKYFEGKDLTSEESKQLLILMYKGRDLYKVDGISNSNDVSQRYKYTSFVCL